MIATMTAAMTGAMTADSMTAANVGTIPVRSAGTTDATTGETTGAQWGPVRGRRTHARVAPEEMARVDATTAGTVPAAVPRPAETTGVPTSAEAVRTAAAIAPRLGAARSAETKVGPVG